MVGWWLVLIYTRTPPTQCNEQATHDIMQIITIFLFLFDFLFFWRQKADMPSPKQRRQLTTWQVFYQVDMRFHSRESNHQPLPWELGICPPSSNNLGSSRTIHNNILWDWQYSCLNVGNIPQNTVSPTKHWYGSELWYTCMKTRIHFGKYLHTVYHAYKYRDNLTFFGGI